MEKIDKKAVLDIIRKHHWRFYINLIHELEKQINALPTTDDGWVSVKKYNHVKHDADIMFNALFSIISVDTIDNFGRCMTVASEAINSITDKTRNDTI